MNNQYALKREAGYLSKYLNMVFEKQKANFV